jgi:2-methylisocitrate lyase-like PEP mutase family enzyme
VPSETRQVEKSRLFLALHHGDGPLVMANPWDAGSARLLASLGFAALATTSSGFAASLGRLDGGATVDEVFGHCRAVVEATDVPVSADLENGFADDPAVVAATVERAVGCGLAGCSIEDSTGHGGSPVYEIGRAADRIAAAAEAAHGGGNPFVLTARAENHLHGRDDLDDTIRRLRRYQEAGADVLYAPGVTQMDGIRRIVESVDGPVNVLALPGVPTVAALAEAGVARISVGGAFAYAALGAVVEAARELLDHGTYGFRERAGIGAAAARAAFAPSA